MKSDKKIKGIDFDPPKSSLLLLPSRRQRRRRQRRRRQRRRSSFSALTVGEFLASLFKQLQFLFVQFSLLTRKQNVKLRNRKKII